jgi:HK97 family phage portal protein
MNWIDTFLAKRGIYTSKAMDELSSKGSIVDMSNYDKSHRVRKTFQGLSEELMLGMYKRSDWVRACVDKIILHVTKVDLKAGAPENQDEDVTPDQQKRIDEVQALLDDPNRRTESLNHIRRQYLRDILIYDAGALEIVYEQGGKKLPVELYAVGGSSIRLNTNDHGMFSDPENAYVIPGRTAAQHVWFADDELIYMLANPQSSSVYGLSPLESLAATVSSDLNAAQHNADFFANNAEASGVLGVEQMGKDALKRFRVYWNEELKGKPHKMIALNGKVTWTPMSQTNRDMQFVEYQRWLLSKIMSVYGVQPIVMGFIDENTGKLNSEEQWNIFTEQVIKPMLALETFYLTTKLVKDAFGYDDVAIVHDVVDTRNEKTESEIAERYVKNDIIEINEARARFLQLPAVDWGSGRPSEGRVVPNIRLAHNPEALVDPETLGLVKGLLNLKKAIEQAQVN